MAGRVDASTRSVFHAFDGMFYTSRRLYEVNLVTSNIWHYIRQDEFITINHITICLLMLLESNPNGGCASGPVYILM